MDFPRDQRWTAGPADGPKVLLLHGLTGSPAELWPLGVALGAAGMRAELPWWPGHGTTPADLGCVSTAEMVEAARALASERPRAVVGMSMGSLLSLVLAADWPGLEALVLLAPPLRMGPSVRLFETLGRLVPDGTRLLDKSTDPPPPILPDQPFGAAGRAAWEATPAPREFRYGKVPLAWGRRLGEVRASALESAARVTTPSLVLHGTADVTALVDSAPQMARLLPRARVQLCIVNGATHRLMSGAARGQVADTVAGFIGRQLAATAQAAAAARAG